MEINTLLSSLYKVNKTASGWTACCPAHDDKSPSLSISESNGKILLHCFAGCTIDTVLEKLGLEAKDLFIDESKSVVRCQVAEYKYTDEKGVYLFSVVRFEPKAFRQRTASGWGLNSTRRVLYRLPRINQAIAEEEMIFICEGEKDVENLEAHGLYATTNPMGAGLHFTGQ